MRSKELLSQTHRMEFTGAKMLRELFLKQFPVIALAVVAITFLGCSTSSTESKPDTVEIPLTEVLERTDLPDSVRSTLEQQLSRPHQHDQEKVARQDDRPSQYDGFQSTG